MSPSRGTREAAGSVLAASSPLEQVLERLDRVKRGGGGFVARCPAHEDRNPSLSVSEGQDGRVLVRCHRGCTVEAIVAAVGLELADLFPRDTSTDRRIVETYDYVDETGTNLFQAVRFAPKAFAQRRPDGSGWTWKLGDTRRVLYRLPQVLSTARAGGTVFVVEGEKDVHALERLGLVATCNAMGAGKWRPDYAESLRGTSRVVILPDDDAPGREHAEQVARSLAGLVDDVRVVELRPRSESGADVHDWICHASSDEELRQARELLEDVVARTPKFSIPPPIALETGGNEKSDGFAATSIESLVANVPPEPAWSWRGYLAPFALSLLAGKPKAGKSTLAFALLAKLAAGEPFVGLETAPSGVLLLSEERRDTLAEKARILGLVSFPPLANPKGEVNRNRPVHVLMRHDAPPVPWPELVRQAMTYAHQQELSVLVIDTWDRWTNLRGESENAAGAVNEALEPLHYAAASGLAILILTHQRKSLGEYGEAVRGSSALTGGVDVVVELERPSPSLALGKEARALRAVSRFGSTPDELFVELDLDDASFHAIESPGEVKAAAERSKLVEVLGGLGDATSKQLSEETGLPESTVRRHLTMLLEQGHVSRQGQGKRGDPHRWQPAGEL